FDLPERVGANDFVLKLTEAIARPESTVKDYVVTDQLRHCFDDALALVKDAITTRRSTGAYLHGSFGTGKSHFMAMLYLLLSNDTRARSMPDLADVVAKHDWTVGKKFLLVPYHMIGAETVEERVLGGYLDRMRELHPDAPPPGLYDADSMMGNARKLRQQFGDEAFFRALNDSAGDDGWGDAARWDTERFEAAARADARSRERSELVGALAHSLMPGARHTVATVDLDTGLALISQHARSLGYDAVILFLDELILWLASRAADAAWLTREGPKLAKLVESGNANRPAPIISFVARQRAIRELIGKAGLGADQALVEEALEWWEKRFSTITLEDRNLATIARRRLLKPKNEAARLLIEAEFNGIGRLGNSVIDTIVTSKGDREQFRELYPFTPALVEVLITVAAALQRERTVLNVMAQILVKARNRMRLGDLVPVGELFVEMRDGYDPFGSGLKQQFDNARKLWERKLRPLIESEAGASYDDLDKLPPDQPQARLLRAHERIAGTLILGGLAPDLEPLRGLTGPRLAALNYGSLRPFLPGTEGRDALTLCRRWVSSGIGEIRVGPGAESQAIISIQLTSVDIESILENAKHEDSHGNRLLKATDLFFAELGM
ncbi:MAG: phage resistance protein, partial [Acidobacteria bacterium]|nr:phage resistance protein [Acidobacteriota bacterium]